MAGLESHSKQEQLRELLRHGDELLEQDRLEESAVSFQNAVDEFPDSARAHYRLGATLGRMERWDEAVAALEKALALEPNLSRAQEMLGDVFTHSGQWKNAYLSYHRAIRENPKDAGLSIKLGDMHRRRGEDERAAEAYRRAAALGGYGDLKRESAARADGAELYLDLMKRCLTFLLWDARDGPLLELRPSRPIETLAHLARRLFRLIRPPSSSLRQFGLDWPAMALTMVGEVRLDNVQYCVEEVLRNGVPGDLIEAGVWRGGVPIFMRAILAARGDEERKVWVADSFEGLPSPNVKDYPADRGYDLSMWKSLAVPLKEVRANFERFGLLDDQVNFLPGWFKDTLPEAPITRLAVMRLDGDLYESTMDALVHLYPKLSPGGYAIIDDYRSAPPCQKAVDDYRRQHQITEAIITVDWSGVYWKRG